MKNFFSGSIGLEHGEKPVLKKLRDVIQFRLLAYPFLSKGSLKRYENKREIDRYMLDSGAFSVWSKGDEIDVDTYIAFIKSTNTMWDYIINLDKIPGKKGQFGSVTPQIREAAAKEGWNNYERLLRAGIDESRLLHVFHQGEDFKWLEMMVEKVAIIGISPANDSPPAQKRMWLDQCMRYLCDSKGNPKVRFHGLAVTSVELMVTYPWYSVDSATWCILGGMGGIFIPHVRNGCIDLTKTPEVLHCGDNNKGRTLHNFTPKIQARIIAKLNESGLFGGDYEAFKRNNNYILRSIINARFFKSVETEINKTVSSYHFVSNGFNF